MFTRTSMVLLVLGLLGHSGVAQAQAAVTVTVNADVPAGYQQPPPPPPQAAPQPVIVQPAPQPVYVAQAQQPMLLPVPGAHEGFFMRFNVGGAFTGMRASSGGSDVSVRGGGPLFSLAFGASVIPRLALYGELWSSIGVNPTVESGGRSGTADSLVVVAIGGGATYYLPSNLYFGLSLGYGAASIAAGGSAGSVGSTEAGFATKVTIGQEWFMGPEWGIGVAGVFGFARFPDSPGSSVDWTVGSLGVALTLTKN